MNDERTLRTPDDEAERAERRPAAAWSGGYEAQAAEDPVDWESEASFPASDPPSSSGAAAVRDGLREEPRGGPQAGWSVEHEADLEGPLSGGGEREAAPPVDPAAPADPRGPAGRPRSA